MTTSIKEALAKQIYYLESIKRQLEEYKDFVSSCEVLAPSIGNEVLADNIDWLDCHVAELKRNDGPSDGAIYAAVSKAETPTDERAAIDAHLDKALATFQPDGERREAIARMIDPEAFEDDRPTWHDRRVRARNRADLILASGLVQNEAGIRRDEREKCAKIADREAEFWQDAESSSARIVAANIRSARDGGAES